MTQKASITTTSSHSAFYNIILGALEEGLVVHAICYDRDWDLWSQYPKLIKKIDIIHVKNFDDPKATVNALNSISDNTIIIPHGSFVRYLSLAELKLIKHPIFGGIKILGFEGDRYRNVNLLKTSNISTPKIFTKVEDIDRPVIVKVHGAEGGKGYFVAFDRNDFKNKSQGKKVDFIQEYISGVSIYAHYFNSPIEKRCELLGFDRRLESNVNAQFLAPFDEPSFTVVGNIPIVVRESLVPEYHSFGRQFVQRTGLIGPFCIETIVTSEQKIYAFEFSGRIVAGTTIWVPYGNTYANALWGEPMYMGKRIAREIKVALKLGKENLLRIDSPNLEEI